MDNVARGQIAAIFTRFLVEEAQIVPGAEAVSDCQECFMISAVSPLS